MMSFHSLLEHFLPWLHRYGSLAIFCWFALGVFALPVPEETLLFLLGFLIAKGKMDIFPTWIAAYLGSCCGVSGSYGLGLVTGPYLTKKWGPYMGLTENRLKKAQYWFERFGKWSLVIGYFIPGVRHLMGYTAGALKLSYRDFSTFAYSGAVLWVSLFIGLGVFSIRIPLL